MPLINLSKYSLDIYLNTMLIHTNPTMYDYTESSARSPLSTWLFPTQDS
jgi:hypothetical protein